MKNVVIYIVDSIIIDAKSFTGLESTNEVIDQILYDYRNNVLDWSFNILDMPKSHRTTVTVDKQLLNSCIQKLDKKLRGTFNVTNTYLINSLLFSYVKHKKQKYESRTKKINGRLSQAVPKRSKRKKV